MRLRLEAMLAETVDADWLARETEAALAADPVPYARLDALDALAAEQGLTLPPALAARRTEAEARRPGVVRACAAGALEAELPDDPVAIRCHFAAALTLVGDGRDLFAEGRRWAAGEPVDGLTVALAAAGVGALALGPAAPVAKSAAAALRTARRLDALSPALRRELAEAGARVVRLDRPGGPAARIDAAAARRLAGGAAEIGRAAAGMGPVAAIRALRHVESLDDAARLRRVAEAMGPRAGRTLDALGPRAFRVFLRTNRALLAAAGLALALAAQLALLAASAGQWAAGRALRRLARG